MKTTTLAVAICLLGSITRADVVKLITGEEVKGTVVNYENMSFEVQVAEGIFRKQTAAAVKQITFDSRSAPITLETRTKGNLQAKVTSYENGAFTLDNGNGKSETLAGMLVTRASFALQAGKDVETITHGSRVEIAKHLVSGQVTVIDFYADWCGPCRMISPYLEKLAKDDPDVVLRKVDIVKWGTPVAEQYQITSIPRIDVYDRAGKLVGTVRGVNQQQVDTFVKQAKGTK